jgi:hypothetical protein
MLIVTVNVVDDDFDVADDDHDSSLLSIVSIL